MVLSRTSMHDDTLLLVGTLDGGMHAISSTTGVLLWSFSSGGRVVASSFLDALEARPGEIGTADASEAGRKGLGAKLASRSPSVPTPLRPPPPPGIPKQMPYFTRRREPQVPYNQLSSWSWSVNAEWPPSTVSPHAPFDATSFELSHGVSRAGKKVLCGKGGKGMAIGDASDGLVVVTGLDGTLYAIGENDKPRRLTEHTLKVLSTFACILRVFAPSLSRPPARRRSIPPSRPPKARRLELSTSFALLFFQGGGRAGSE